MSFEVVFTREAEEQARASGQWWRENRADSPDKFDVELSEIVARLQQDPTVAQRYRARPLVYRMLMKVTRCHVCFTVALDLNLVTVHGVWGGPRRRGPPLFRR